MKQTTTILAALAMSVATAAAGVTTSYSSGKDQPPPPPPVDPCAGPISYNNIELLYAHSDWGFDSVDGGILRAEYSPMQNFYLAASIEYTDLEEDFGFQDLWEFSIGLGGYFPLTENIHLAADVGYLNVRYDQLNDGDDPLDDIDDFFDSESDSGWYARPHLRGKWGCFTAHAGAIYRNYGDNNDNFGDEDLFDGGDWAYFIKLYYQIHTNWDITAGYLNGDHDFDQWTVGARYRF